MTRFVTLFAVLAASTWASSVVGEGFISLSVSGSKPFGNADFENLGAVERFRYISMPATGASSVITDFSLPQDYFPGTGVQVRYMVNSINSGCLVVFGASSVWESLSMSAFARIQFPGRAPSIIPSWTAMSSELRPFKLSILPPSAIQFSPGDSISISLERDGNGLNDTCPSKILISGISVHYATGNAIFRDGFEAD